MIIHILSIEITWDIFLFICIDEIIKQIQQLAKFCVRMAPCDDLIVLLFFYFYGKYLKNKEGNEKRREKEKARCKRGIRIKYSKIFTLNFFRLLLIDACFIDSFIGILSLYTLSFKLFSPFQSFKFEIQF